MSVYILQNDFDTAVVEASKTKPVLVDFFAEWCGPCKMIAPLLEELSEELGDSASIVKVDVDANRELAGAHQIMSIPTLMIFKDGEIAEKIIGLRGKEELKALLEKHQ